MTPREVLTQVEAAGHHLDLRPGGLRLICKGDPDPDLLDLLQEHRPELISFLEAEERLWAAHQASLEAGRITHFPESLLDLIHPSLHALVSISH